jgi:hypothetical protein
MNRFASSSLAGPWWHEPRARPLSVWGAILVASGLVHIAVWAVLGGPWEGPVTWRKPILFGISGGLTSLSLGWAWAQLPWRRGDLWLSRITAWALAIEVALIDLQRWRGVASHFNRQTSLDSWLYDVMGGLILMVTLVIVDLTIRFFWQRPSLPADMLLATRAGLVLLVVSCLLGIWASVHGDTQVARGLTPEIYGAAGVVKFPHGVVIHAIQGLPFIAWVARRAGLGDRSRTLLVAVATAASVLMLGYALAQTLAGRPRFGIQARIPRVERTTATPPTSSRPALMPTTALAAVASGISHGDGPCPSTESQAVRS